MSDKQAELYEEFVPPGLLSIWDAAKPLGFGLSGFLGNDAHTYGAHLSEARLQATGRPGDYTLRPAPAANNHRAGAGIDLGTGPVGSGPVWSGEWLDWVRRQCQSGAITFVGELIGDPDLIPGPRTDAHTHMYATAPDWSWVPYTGTGHVAWCHLWIRRDRLGDTSLGARLFDGWGKDGRTEEEDEMSTSDVNAIIHAATFSIPGHTYRTLDEILPAAFRVIDTLGSQHWQDALVDRVAEAVITKLRASPQ